MAPLPCSAPRRRPGIPGPGAEGRLCCLPLSTACLFLTDLRAAYIVKIVILTSSPYLCCQRFPRFVAGVFVVSAIYMHDCPAALSHIQRLFSS